MRYGKPTKNKKRIDPRYFLEETTNRDQLEEEFPWISSQQWDAIEDQSLPSLAEYVNAREWKVPIY